METWWPGLRLYSSRATAMSSSLRRCTGSRRRPEPRPPVEGTVDRRDGSVLTRARGTFPGRLDIMASAHPDLDVMSNYTEPVTTRRVAGPGGVGLAGAGHGGGGPPEGP